MFWKNNQPSVTPASDYVFARSRRLVIASIPSSLCHRMQCCLVDRFVDKRTQLSILVFEELFGSIEFKLYLGGQHGVMTERTNSDSQCAQRPRPSGEE